MKFTKRLCILAAMATVLVAPFTASAGLTFYTSEADWTAAIAAIDPAAIFNGEDFNGVAVDGANPGLGAGPHSYAGGELDISLNEIGSNGSFTGVINPGAFDASNALQVRLVFDTSDSFTPANGLPFDLLGEGVKRMDFAFANAVIGFAAEWQSVNTHDSVAISVNGGPSFELSDHLPIDPISNDSDGFFGWVDDALFSSFTMVSGGVTFEEFEMDKMQHATPIPAPGACLLAFVGMGMVGSVRRRFS